MKRVIGAQKQVCWNNEHNAAMRAHTEQPNVWNWSWWSFEKFLAAACAEKVQYANYSDNSAAE